MTQKTEHRKLLQALSEDKIVTKLDAMKVIIHQEHQHSTSEKRYKMRIKAFKILGFNEWEREELYSLGNYSKLYEKLGENTENQTPVFQAPASQEHVAVIS